eukprot:g9664.t1
MHRTLARRRKDLLEDGGSDTQIQKLSIINLWELQGGNLDLVTTTWLGGKIQERKPIAFAMLWNYERHGTEHHAIAALARTSKPAAKTEDVKWPSAADLLRSAFEEAFPHFPRGRSEKTQEAGRGTEDGVSAAALLRSAFEEAFPNFPRRST